MHLNNERIGQILVDIESAIKASCHATHERFFRFHKIPHATFYRMRNVYADGQEQVVREATLANIERVIALYGSHFTKPTKQHELATPPKTEAPVQPKPKVTADAVGLKTLMGNIGDLVLREAHITGDGELWLILADKEANK